MLHLYIYECQNVLLTVTVTVTYITVLRIRTVQPVHIVTESITNKIEHCTIGYEPADLTVHPPPPKKKLLWIG